MKTINILAVLFVLMLLGCKDADELYDDPNSATNVPPSSIFTKVLLDMQELPYEVFYGPAQRYTQHFVCIEPIYGNQNYNFGETEFYYGTLRDILQMEKEAQRAGSETAEIYTVMAKFFKAYFYVYMTERVGDIPMSEAMKGAVDNNFTPQYDTQKQVYLQCFDLLEQANSELEIIIENGATISNGDIFYDGNLAKWQKVVNVFRLRMLMSLSLKINDADLELKEQFAAIISNPDKYAVFTSNEDNLSIHWIDNADNKNPIYPGKRPYRELEVLGDTYVSLVKELEDPRLFVVADPAPALNVGVENRELLFSSYQGAKSGDDINELKDEAVIDGKYSTRSYSYWYKPVCEPTIQIGYPELQFVIAEAINRGWISGNAALYYNNGIKASMLHYGIEISVIDAYLAKNNITYKGNNTDGLNQILTQKYIAFFNNSGWQAFFDYRRTGIPTFDIGPANENGLRIPKRWKYPDNEVKYNSDELGIALDRQFQGADDINLMMWMLN
ncbi:SusD/RagB family nutrient-binding outer membrane lipoprotein [Saccharicrinis sp. GN24d3]|uniref:SusD/RagB family nutrient-binding outer membrane lipoprotein n=1 Tax=Saccharicrinis sp. GN24d3 TaxID=3458416 RepID=UPI0040370AAC